jgi:phosphomannomutase
MRLKGKAYRDITIEKAARIGYAIGKIVGEKNLVISGRDAFRVSRMLKRAISAGVMSAGADVMDFHESTTGEIAFAIKRFGAKMGFMVSLDPALSGVYIRVFSSPGYELVGSELNQLLDYISGEIIEPREVGWVYYAEYMHRLYSAAISSFVRGDLISSKKPSVVTAPDYEPLETIFLEIARGLSFNQVIIGGVDLPSYPMINLMKRVWRVRKALESDIGVLVSPEGSSITVAIEHAGFLLPEEVLQLVLEKYTPGVKVNVLNPVSKTIIEHLEKNGYRVKVFNDEEKFLLDTRRERPTISMNSRGEFITPIFSLGYDAITAFVQVLEAFSEKGSKLLQDVSATRDQMVYEFIDVATALRICSEKAEPTPWGCRFTIGSTLYSLIYNPEVDGFIKITDRIPEAS